MAARIASRAPLSVEATKRMASRALDMDRKAADAMMAEEVETLSASEDHTGAVAAFVDRRQPPPFKRR